jgi:hypothetical protein
MGAAMHLQGQSRLEKLLTIRTECKHILPLIAAASPQRWDPQIKSAIRVTKAMAMTVRKYPVFVESSEGRNQAGFSAPANATPVEVSLVLREKGWRAYRVRADHSACAWVATIIDWKSAA